MITDDDVMRLFEQADPARHEPGAAPVDAADYLDAVRAQESGDDVVVFDLEPTRDERAPHERAGRRPWLVAAAVVALALLVSSALVWSASSDDGPSVPAGPEPTSTTVPRTINLEPPVLSREGGPPSTPETGELVAAISISHDIAIALYADGRLIGGPDLSEKRLTADGVERVRQEFLAAGVFDGADPQPGDLRVWYACQCVIRLRDGGNVLNSEAGGYPEPTIAVDPELDRRVGVLIEFVTDLESSLPSNAWVDREGKPYVPSKYRVGVLVDGRVDQAVPDLASLLALLPTPLVERLNAQGWLHTPWGDSVDISLADARALVESLADAGLGGVPPTLVASYPLPGGSTYVQLTPILPDGEPPYLAPG